MFGRFQQPFAFRCLAAGLVLILASALASGELQAAKISFRPSNYGLPPGGCSDRYWVALADGAGLPASVCPTVEGWRKEFLFNANLRNLNGPRFCRYFWNPPISKTERGEPGMPPLLLADIARLQATEHLHGTVRRCGVLGASGTTLAERNQEVMFREFRFQTGDTDLPFLTASSDVRLAVLDTYPTGDFPAKEKDPVVCKTGHGFAIAHLIEELICDGSGGEFKECAAAMTGRLALPLGGPGSGSLDQPDPPIGSGCGGYGSPLDLALAIRDEVAAWKKSGIRHLVLNLSVGWDSNLLHKGLGAEAADGLNAEELSVYAALRNAAAQGALSIAATGNGQGVALSETGPLLPAGWYAKPPTIALLAPVPLTTIDPVVWPIGATDRNGQPLGNARPGAEPPLVAYGDHATVKLLGDGWTDPLTGSSVGAAVASSLAALAWRFQPALERQEVMEMLAASATPLVRDAAYHRNPSQSPPRVRRLSVNALLSRAWSPPKVLATPPTSGQTTVDCAGGSWIPTTAGPKLYSCPGTAVPAQASAMPLLTPLGAVPWVQTQPGANACPSCSLGGGGGGMLRGIQTPKQIDLRLEIPPDWNPQLQLTDLWIEASDAQGAKTTVWIGKPAKLLAPNDSIQVQSLPFPRDLRAAVLSARVKVGPKDYSLRMPIYVDPGE
ncbi:MAG: S8 family serine peptidase [Acidobacteriota bacterium]